jgi:hypothetical protein
MPVAPGAERPPWNQADLGGLHDEPIAEMDVCAASRVTERPERRSAQEQL